MTHAEAPPVAPPKSSAAFKVVPPVRADRDRVRELADKAAAKLDRATPPSKDTTREVSELILKQVGLADEYLGFTMVMVTNAFWRDQVAAVPFNRRLLLLPHCLKHAEGCPADYDEFGLDCEKCGACSVADFKTKAEKLGYKVLVSEGTPIVLKIIVSGHVDAIVGVACLNVLEKAYEKVLIAGIPCVATPLLSSNCKSTSVDQDWVFEAIDLHTPPAGQKTKSYVPLMRAANTLFDEPELSRLAPRPRKSPADVTQPDPLLKHEAIAYDFLGRGGKRSRPFITLAAYDALTGGRATLGEEGTLPDTVKHAAVAIEAFHKASLVHDDIQDDDSYRYGVETLHRIHGVGPAINIGDYLLGLGYRLVSRDRKEIGAETAADVLDKLADAHLKLSEGQGAELLWRDAADKRITPVEALKIYALKTSPAFEAALYAGVRLAGSAEPYEKLLAEFARNVGVGFQILNDLKDWAEDGDNKLIAGGDVLSARPTLLLALALEAASPAEKDELLRILAGSKAPESALERVRTLYHKLKVFAAAEKLVAKFRAKAESLADDVQPEPFREFLYYLIDSVLEPAQLPAVPASLRAVPVELGILRPAAATSV